MERITFYQAINGWADMTELDLERGYRDTIINNHPDAHYGATPEELAVFEAAYVRATEAWAVLGDRRKRYAYNRLNYVLGKACTQCSTQGFIKVRPEGVKYSRIRVKVICPACQGTGYILTATTTPESQAK